MNEGVMSVADAVKILGAAERERTLVLKSLLSDAVKARLIASIDAKVKACDDLLKAAADAPVQGAVASGRKP